MQIYSIKGIRIDGISACVPERREDNETALRALYGDEGYLTASADELTAAADTLARRNHATVFCTLGANGSYLTKGANGVRTPAAPVKGPLDICGAGDTTLAAFACALAAGAAFCYSMPSSVHSTD